MKVDIQNWKETAKEVARMIQAEVHDQPPQATLAHFHHIMYDELQFGLSRSRNFLAAFYSLVADNLGMITTIIGPGWVDNKQLGSYYRGPCVRVIWGDDKMVIDPRNGKIIDDDPISPVEY